MLKRSAVAVLAAAAVSVGVAGCGGGDAPDAVIPTGPHAQAEALWNAASADARASFCESELERDGVTVADANGKPMGQAEQDAFSELLRERC